MVKEIELTKGAVTLVDDADFDTLSKYTWSLHTKGYACRRTRKDDVNASGHNVLMHRQLLTPPPGLQVDHVNGNKLDNRRENLRLATRGQNQANSISPRNTSGFRGVSRHGPRWSAQITFDQVGHHLGVFDTPEDAARVYDVKAVELFGPFARTNFPVTEVVNPLAA